MLKPLTLMARVLAILSITIVQAQTSLNSSMLCYISADNTSHKVDADLTPEQSYTITCTYNDVEAAIPKFIQFSCEGSARITVDINITNGTQQQKITKEIQVAPRPLVHPTAAEKAHQISAQRHSHDAKPLMDVSVTRYSDAELAVFKGVILKKIAKAKEEIDFYTEQIRNTSESETQFASIDDGSMTSERENMNQIVVRMQKLISHLESALVRIENKSYGICRETGKLIPKERLMVVPHATLSVEGKKLEKK